MGDVVYVRTVIVNRSKRNDEIVQRIEYIRNYLGLNKSRFSTEIGLKPQTYNNFIGAQASKPSVELISGIVNRFGVSPGWILNGSGSVFTERSPEQESRFAPPGVSPPRLRPWGDQVADSAQQGGWKSEPEGELQQKITRLENLVRALENRVESLAGTVPGLRELNALLLRLHEIDPEAARGHVAALHSQVRRDLDERGTG